MLGKNYKILVIDLVVVASLTLITAWLLEFLKPGIISSYFDLNALLVILAIACILTLILPVGHWRLPSGLIWYLILWGLAATGLFVKLVWNLTAQKRPMFYLLITATVLAFIAIMILLARLRKNHA